MIKILTLMWQGHTYFELLCVWFFAMHLYPKSYLEIKLPSGEYKINIYNFTDLMSEPVSWYVIHCGSNWEFVYVY